MIPRAPSLPRSGRRRRTGWFYRPVVQWINSERCMSRKAMMMVMVVMMVMVMGTSDSRDGACGREGCRHRHRHLVHPVAIRADLVNDRAHIHACGTPRSVKVEQAWPPRGEYGSHRRHIQFHSFFFKLPEFRGACDHNGPSRGPDLILPCAWRFTFCVWSCFYTRARVGTLQIPSCHSSPQSPVPSLGSPVSGPQSRVPSLVLWHRITRRWAITSRRTC